MTLRWNLRELHALGLVGYNRRADRYHVVRMGYSITKGQRGGRAGAKNRAEASPGRLVRDNKRTMARHHRPGIVS